ncbi:MAG: hypothetical protein MK188_04750 [Gammaproteobacteria bacterium]|nr:hypothetical protein [Gammaproteobacteria bacterium]
MVLLFLATGAYMIFSFPELYSGREEVRMMFRASHIYLLFAALINLMAANVRTSDRKGKHDLAFNLSSGLIIGSTILFAVAFWVEPVVYAIHRPITFWAVVSMFVGVLAHTAIGLWQSRRKA